VNSVPVHPPTPHFQYTFTQVRPSGKSLKNYVAILWLEVFQPWLTVRSFVLPHYEPNVVIGGISSNLQRLKSSLPESSGRKRRGNLSYKPETCLYYPPFSGRNEAYENRIAQGCPTSTQWGALNPHGLAKGPHFCMHVRKTAGDWVTWNFKFNAFHTIVLKFNLLRNRQTQKIIGHRLQGVLYNIQQDDMFRSTSTIIRSVRAIAYNI
jgi:hypothetical protein